MFNNNKYSDSFVIIFIYTFAFFSILLNNGLFWDGWVINNSSTDQLIQMFKDNGNYWYGYIFALIKSSGELVLLSRIITFLSYLFVGLFFYQILKKFTFDLSRYSLIITLYFITFPVNFARITVMNTPYAICLMLFVLAYYLALKNKKNLIEIFLTYFFLFISLFMSSLLFLIPVLLAHKFLYYQYSVSYKEIRDFLISNIFLIIIPLTYIVIKLLFLDSGGMYEDSNYNQITLNRIAALPLRFIYGFYSSIIVPMTLSINYAASNLLIVLIVLFIINKVKIFHSDMFDDRKININFKMLFFSSFVLLFLGMFAYLLVGKTPSLINWNSRHQILLPVGASIFLFSIIYFWLNNIKSEGLRKQFVLLPVAIFIVFNINIYFSYIVDWYKQESFIENVLESDKLMQSPTFIVVDNTKEINALNRSKSFIDYTGIFKQRFIKENKLATEDYLLDTNEYLKYKGDKVYGISDWMPSLPEYIVYLNYGSFAIDNVIVFKMMFNNLFNSNKNLISIKKILDFEIKTIGNNND